MEELKSKIANYRRFMHRKELSEENKDKEIELRELALKALEEYPNKEEAASVWNKQMTGFYD